MGVYWPCIYEMVMFFICHTDPGSALMYSSYVCLCKLCSELLKIHSEERGNCLSSRCSKWEDSKDGAVEDECSSRDRPLMMYSRTSVTFCTPDWIFLVLRSLMWRPQDDSACDVWAALTSVFPTRYPSWVPPSLPFCFKQPIPAHPPHNIHWPLGFHGNRRRS